MSEILSIEELKKLAFTIIEIPGFDGEGTINVKVQRPNIMSMLAQGKIPNHLLSIAVSLVKGQGIPQGKKDDAVDQLKNMQLAVELYARTCLVEPNYEEFKEIMTDKQADELFLWGVSGIKKLATFRDDGEDDTDNKDGETL